MAASHQQTLDRIREAVLDSRYIVTPHAWAEMREDGLTVVDIESALLGGKIERAYTRDPRGVRYRVIGTAVDLEAMVAVIVRFVVDEQLLIITAFVVGEEG